MNHNIKSATSKFSKTSLNLKQNSTAIELRDNRSIYFRIRDSETDLKDACNQLILRQKSLLQHLELNENKIKISMRNWIFVIYSPVIIT